LGLVIAVGWLALSGCKSTPAKVNTGPIKATTFSFVHTGAVPDAEFAENRQAIHELIQTAMVNTLARKGLTRVPSGGDVTVAYLLIVGNNATTTSINDYFGYGRDAAGLVDKAHQEFAVKDKNPNYFEAGTLVVDIVDGKTFKLLRRNYVVRPILGDLPPEARQARIQQAVEEVFQGLRVEY